MKKLFEDDPIAENWDKHGRHYNRETEIRTSTSMNDLMFLGTSKIYDEGYRRKCARKNCKKRFVPRIANKWHCSDKCRNITRLTKADAKSL